MHFTPFEPRTGTVGALDFVQHRLDRNLADQGVGQHDGMRAHSLSRFDQRAVRVVPTTDQEHPMLDEQAEQFGIDFAQRSPGIARALRIEHALPLPQPEQLGWDVGEHEAVAGQQELLVAGPSPMLLGGAHQLLAEFGTEVHRVLGKKC